MNGTIGGIKSVEIADVLKYTGSGLQYQVDKTDSTDTEYIKKIFDDIMASKECFLNGTGLNYITDYGEVRVDFKDRAIYVYHDICDDSCSVIELNGNVLRLMDVKLQQKIYGHMRKAGIGLVEKNCGVKK